MGGQLRRKMRYATQIGVITHQNGVLSTSMVTVWCFMCSNRVCKPFTSLESMPPVLFCEVPSVAVSPMRGPFLMRCARQILHNTVACTEQTGLPSISSFPRWVEFTGSLLSGDIQCISWCPHRLRERFRRPERLPADLTNAPKSYRLEDTDYFFLVEIE